MQGARHSLQETVVQGTKQAPKQHWQLLVTSSRVSKGREGRLFQASPQTTMAALDDQLQGQKGEGG